VLTPKEVQEKTFPKTAVGGYKLQAVDEFMDPLIDDYTALYKENSVLKSKLRILVEKLEEYRNQELSMKRALLSAQHTADDMIADAQKKAAAILNNAQSSVRADVSANEAAAAAAQQEARLAMAAAQQEARIAEACAQQEARLAELRQEVEAEQARVEQARAAARSFIEAMETEIRKSAGSLDRLKQLSKYTAPEAPSEAPAAPLPVEEAPIQPAEPAEEKPAEQVAPVVEMPAAQEAPKPESVAVTVEPESAPGPVVIEKPAVSQADNIIQATQRIAFESLRDIPVSPYNSKSSGANAAGLFDTDCATEIVIPDRAPSEKSTRLMDTLFASDGSLEPGGEFLLPDDE